MNPIIKFTTLFGLLAVELAIELSRTTRGVLFVVFLLVAFFFVRRSFYGMRIEAASPSARGSAEPPSLAAVK
jgi:K(+)-stimulated pyrophosphate-energized sodium pump